MKTEENTKKEEMKNEKTAGNAVVFENPEFGKIRTLTDEDGEPLFCAKDVCDVLGYKNQRDAIQRHVDDPCVVKHDVWVVTGKKKDGAAANRWCQMTFVNESGFYALVLGSKLPTAVKFKNWVTSEVLPQIRKTGVFRYCHCQLTLSAYLSVNSFILIYLSVCFSMYFSSMRLFRYLQVLRSLIPSVSAFSLICL